MPRDINSWWQPYWIFSKWPPPKMKEFTLFHIFLSTWNILMVLVSSVIFGGKGIWIWCSADNNISSWWIVLRSGSKIRLKKSIFSQISFCQITLQQQAIYESIFLKSSFIWMHITRSTTYYLLPWPPHWIIKMANHAMCDGKCHSSQLWMLQFFLKTSHI